MISTKNEAGLHELRSTCSSDQTWLDWNPKICFYTLWYAICHE